jgi:CRP/FNR family transcriptional regulator/CRP/FNR family cyclic AMP-dependent transcriptional regulator
MTSMDRRELLRRIHLFADLTDRERDIILDLMRERTVAKGTTIFNQHDSGGGLYLILAGSVKIWRTARDGRDVTVAVLNEGNFFGEMSLLDGQPRSASATAIQAARLLVLDREHFQRQVLAQPHIVAKLLGELSKRLRAADQAIEHLALGSVHDRLFHLLGHLGRRAPLKAGKGLIERAPTHQELAEMVGSSRETVTRTLAALEKEGLIAIDRRRVTLLPAFFDAESAREG